jgi:hypothetical protein
MRISCLGFMGNETEGDRKKQFLLPIRYGQLEFLQFLKG